MSKQRVALVTGGAKRVGRAVCLELADAGFDIAIHYRSSEDAARELEDELRSVGRRCELVRGDLADPDQTKAVVDQVIASLDGLNVLVNNASVFNRLPFLETDPADWEQTLRVNLISPAMLTRWAVPALREAGDGCVINFTDVHAERPIQNHAAYCASKAGLVNLTKSLALELAPEIRVNSIAPGIAVFPEGYDEQTRQRHINRVPLQRSGTPEDMARVVRFLVTEGTYITGQVIQVDGGKAVGLNPYQAG